MSNINLQLKELTEAVAKSYAVLHTDFPKPDQAALDFQPGDVHAVLAYLKGQGFRQLSMLSCVDWIEDGQFQLVYLLFNWEAGLRLQVRTRIDRAHPVFTTITGIYPGAKYYERDVHEFFGVEFNGNPDSFKPLFLENWDDMPPMRKDFDPQAYSDRKYQAREYKTDFNTKAGEGQ